jgi:hypothetical protein
LTRGKLKGGALCLALAALLVAPATAGAINPVSFSQVGNMGTARDAPGAAPLPDGKVLVAGGYNATDAALNTAEIFDPATNTFSSVGVAMLSERYAPAVAKLPDGRVLIAGGSNDSVDVTSAEVFNPSTGSFSPVGSMGVARELAGAAPLGDGSVLVAAGYSNGTTLNSTEIFNPQTNTFSPGPALPYSTYGDAVVAISGGRVLIAGGYDNGSGTYFDTAVGFDPSTSTFSAVGSLPSPNYGPAAASLPQGRALIAGGYDPNGNPTHILTSATIFSPATNSFSSAGIGNLAGKREEAAGAALADGRALVAGGLDDDGAVNTAEVLSVPSNAFTAKLKGRRVKFTVTNEGSASVSDVSAKTASAAKKKKKPKLVKTKSQHGGPGNIVVKVKLTAAGSARLAQKGKLRIRVTYTPDGGLAATKKLKLRAGK